MNYKLIFLNTRESTNKYYQIEAIRILNKKIDQIPSTSK